MKRVLFFLLLCSGLNMAAAEVTTFEEAGMVENIDLGQNLIRVNEHNFYLPSSVHLHDGKVAIFQLKPGYVVSFDGDLARPYNRINSLYIHTLSIQEAEENFRMLNEQRSGVAHE